MIKLWDLLRNDRNFILFWHRFGNSEMGIRQILRKYTDLPIIKEKRYIYMGVEGDLKWIKKERSYEFYFFHGLMGMELVNKKWKREKMANTGKLLPISALPGIKNHEKLYYLIEIKNGIGGYEEMVISLDRVLREMNLHEKVIFGSSTLSQLVKIKAIFPSYPVIFFSQYFSKRKQFFQLPKKEIRKNLKHGFFLTINQLDKIDIICNTGPSQKNDLRVVRKASEYLNHYQKEFFPGAFKDKETFEFALKNDCKGIFLYGNPQRFILC
jgi:hypothetical protein